MLSNKGAAEVTKVEGYLFSAPLKGGERQVRNRSNRKKT